MFVSRAKLEKTSEKFLMRTYKPTKTRLKGILGWLGSKELERQSYCKSYNGKEQSARRCGGRSTLYMEIFMVKSSMSKQSHTQYKVHRL